MEQTSGYIMIGAVFCFRQICLCSPTRCAASSTLPEYWLLNRLTGSQMIASDNFCARMPLLQLRQPREQGSHDRVGRFF